ncbi:MAG: hypothetical protein F4X83_03235 [Chloroflexi bacterium]|nr:hypothetical protein [Chloroflexota bacterium]
MRREVRALRCLGGCTAVTDYLRRIGPALRPLFEQRFETAPARQAQVDFVEFLVELADPPGLRRRVCLFSSWCCATAAGCGGASAQPEAGRRAALPRADV